MWQYNNKNKNSKNTENNSKQELTLGNIEMSEKIFYQCYIILDGYNR